ncbi:DUF4102 domain-containing protein [Sphingomonas parva]|uniref:DUF4102 domain-containing protein n=1 Tax=Sphingomonas parva TaxID=2555898 RepID=A0A4Y8ZRT2_9SPHN|nr:integrase arm-type DNA-binding domain-containing protein [Sphingomonas parva]TFI57499.1 DUF4102 domain-containing protein [Sphingomonas parva]
MLTDAECRGAKAREKAYKLADGGGLLLHVSTSGHRSWRFKYRFGGKEKQRVLGSYPELGLKEARAMRDDDKRLLREGKDPSIEAKRAALASRVSAADTFELLAREWYGKQKARWKPVHAADVLESLERDVFPDLGALPVVSISAPLVLATLQKVEKRGAIETAHRLRQRISAVFVYGIAAGRAGFDPAASLGKVLEAKPSGRRWPAVTTIERARKVLAATDSAEATPTVKLASRFLALTAQRPGMIRWLKWDELQGVDLKGDSTPGMAMWKIPAGKMKQELALRDDQAFEHQVPLVPEAVEVLRQAYAFSSGSEYVFSGGHSILRPMSENALSYLYLREGLRGIHVPHGWRATFSTLMNEWVNAQGLENDRMVIDLMLAHVPAGISASELRYNRAMFMNRRWELAAIWAESLLKGASSAAAVVEGRRRGRV